MIYTGQKFNSCFTDIGIMMVDQDGEEFKKDNASDLLGGLRIWSMSS